MVRKRFLIACVVCSLLLGCDKDPGHTLAIYEDFAADQASAIKSYRAEWEFRMQGHKANEAAPSTRMLAIAANLAEVDEPHKGEYIEYIIHAGYHAPNNEMLYDAMRAMSVLDDSESLRFLRKAANSPSFPEPALADRLLESRLKRDRTNLDVAARAGSSPD
jgi:hypothetical protein